MLTTSRPLAVPRDLVPTAGVSSFSMRTSKAAVNSQAHKKISI